MKHTRKGRNRKVFKQGSAHITFTGKSVTANAGMAMVSRGFQAFHIPEQLEAATADLDQNKRYPTHELLQQLIALRIIGGEAIQDVRLLEEPAMKRMFQWKHIVHPTSYGRRLKTMTWQHNLNLEKISTHLSSLVAKPGKKFITVDSSVCTVHGQKVEGADTGYNPHKPGRNSYHPLLAVDINSRAVIDGYLRPGSCASNDGLDGFVRKIVSEADLPAEDIIFRFDKGLTSGSILDTIEELGAGYVAKAKLSSTIMGQISRIKNWRSIGNGHFAANFYRRLSGWSRSRRFAVIERNLPTTKPSEQMLLFNILEGRYEVVVTNLRLKAENIWRQYNKGAIVEQVIEEIKNDFAAACIRTNEFWANDALFQTGLIAYNLLNCIKALALPKWLRAARIKRLGFLLIHLPANIVVRGRQFWIKLKRDHPMRLIFYRAMKALA
ncbi:MAG: IS1380 family transposase [Desulfobacter sp.]|nr:MAG: IS1380 family transposase [Desulfobacter sp.]